MKSTFLYVLYLLFGLFSVYCLYTLVADSYEIRFVMRNETDPLQFLACVDLSRVCPDRTEIDLKELRDHLYDHFNSSEEYRYKRRRYPRRFELILNRTKSGGYLVFNRRICFIAKDQEELVEFRNFLSSNGVCFAMKSDTFDLVRMASPNDHINQLIVVKEHPSKCDPSNGRFFCLNECFKSHFRLSRYFYQANETGRILLHFNESNRTIQEAERICFGQCKRENCKLVQLISADKSKEPKTFEAEPVLSAFNFWVDMVGLTLLLVGLFYQFASTISKMQEENRRRKMETVLFYVNLAIILFSLAYWGYLSVRVALEWQTDVKPQEREMSRNLIHPKSVHLAICVAINNEKFKNMTMSEVERATDGMLDNALEGIYVSDGRRSFRADYQVHRKILFKDYQRCFPLSIQLNYQTIPSRPILTVRFKKNAPYSQLYLLSEEENLNSKSFEYDGFAFQKRIVKRLKSRGCVEYEEKYWNCTGRENCVERCIARKFIKRYNRTTFGYFRDLVIDRDWFSPSEWNSLKLMDISDEDESLFLNISRECFKIFSGLKPCDETTFESTFKISQPDDQTLEIDLQFDVVQSAEKLPSSFRMALDLLGIQSIFFGFTLLQLFWLVNKFTKSKWRVTNHKVIWFIYLLALIGCSWTTVRMLDGIVNEELVPTEHNEVVEWSREMPAMVFCLRIDQKLINRNHKLTGRYLEELTRNITPNSTFKSILYLNKSNEWTLFNLHRVERFFLLDMKCFRFHIEDYDRNQFHFSGDTQILRVNFTLTIRKELVHFMAQSRETAEFSKLLNLDYSRSYSKYRITHERSLYEHEDRFGFFRRHFPPLPEGDVGDLHRQLLELQNNEPHRRTLHLPLKEEHFDLEVDEDHFEQLYLAQKKKNSNKRTNLNYRQTFVTNHLRRDDRYVNELNSDFSFNVIFLRRVMHYTNEVNYTTLTLSILFLFFFWTLLWTRFTCAH